MSPRPSLLVTPFLVMFLAACNCDKVVIPQSDTTPPSVAMLAAIANKSDVVSNTPVNENIASPNVDLEMIAVAQDEDGGVSNVQIEGDVDLNCVNTPLGLGQTKSAYFLVSNPVNSKPGDQACTTGLNALKIAPLSQVASCSPGYSFLSLDGTFTASGMNFSGGRTSTATYSFSTGTGSQLKAKDLKERGANQKDCTVKLKKNRRLKKVSCVEMTYPLGLLDKKP